MRAKQYLAGWLLFSCSIPAAEQHFWEKQEPTTWTRQQVTQFTTSSPWAKEVTAVLTTNESNMAGAMESRNARGRSSRENANGVPSPSALPNLQAIVQWVSAKPMQEVLKPHLPSGFQGRYVICVTGLPLGGDTTQVTDETTLQVKRGEPVHPEAAYQDPVDTSAIYFAFLPSTIDVSAAKTAIFSMTAEPYSVKARFNMGEMKYHGNPAL